MAASAAMASHKRIVVTVLCAVVTVLFAVVTVPNRKHVDDSERCCGLSGVSNGEHVDASEWCCGVLWCWCIAQLAQVAIDPELHNIWCFPSACDGSRYVAAGRHGQVEVAVERPCQDRS